LTKLTSINVFGGLILGYNTGIIADALGPINDEFHLTDFQKGLVTSSVLVGGMIGSLAGGPLADALGRRKAAFITGLIGMTGALAACFSPSWQVFTAIRAYLGLSVGLTCVVCPLAVSESAPVESRGFLGTFFQLSITFGIVVAYTVGYLLLHVHNSWRLMIGLGAIPGFVLLLISLVWMKESEVWLANKRGGDTERTPLTRRPFDDEEENSDGGFRSLFRKRNTKPLIVGLLLTIVLQLTGVNTIIYYAPKIFSNAGASPNTALLATIGIGGWNFVTTLTATFVVDKYGRRPLFLTALAVCVLSTLGLGFNYKFAADHPHILTGVAIAGVCLFLAGFEAGPGPLFFVIINEIFEPKDRGAAGSVMNLLQWSWNLAISLLFLPLIEAITITWTYWLFTLVGLIGGGLLFLMLPETKGRATFDEIWSVNS